MTNTRGEACRKAADLTKSDNERAAWLAAAAAWDTCQLPKPPLSARGRELAALRAVGKLLAMVPSEAERDEPPSYTPEPPKPEPVKPQPTGAGCALRGASQSNIALTQAASG
jgi:hypothetical protein